MKFSRRHFLQGLSVAAGALALPFMNRQSSADTGNFPKRLIIFATPNGTVFNELWPVPGNNPPLNSPAVGGGGNNFAFKRILQPLMPLKSKVSLLRGLDMKSALIEPVPVNHEPDNANMLTGYQGTPLQPGGMSIDQHIGNALGQFTKFSSLQFGVQTGAYHISARGKGQPVVGEDDPMQAFNRIFGDFTLDPAELARVRAQRQSILDGVSAELNDIRCKLGSVEAAKFDAHLTSVRELEKQLVTAVGACTVPKTPSTMDIQDPTNFAAVGKLQMDNLVAAIACDLTRVATLQWSNDASSIVHTWAGVPSGAGHHSLGHREVAGVDEATAEDYLTKIETWYCEQFLYLCQKLEAIPEGNGTMLDNCVVLWCHEQSLGEIHQRVDMPYVMAGSASGFFKPGKAIDFKGQPHTRLLSTVATAVGVPTNSFGDPQFNSSPLTELS
ncbi:hypothetical protein AKJ09_04845 [Labilithrix luteola]|uniref:Tat (Twin-arginine translocation) pathway signal sequence domain protein n=1 Tax=Labilithrix luteola TaxID=1391654 RepID=A0A0K1PXR3_9BACT|nr:DUF1552 domain-containing protein [Labilithrix luteola]AKU98181.1 hypothetical protein AKJ09_04845 [Labilithrix luteola]